MLLKLLGFGHVRKAYQSLTVESPFQFVATISRAVLENFLPLFISLLFKIKNNEIVACKLLHHKSKLSPSGRGNKRQNFLLCSGIPIALKYFVVRRRARNKPREPSYKLSVRLDCCAVSDKVPNMIYIAFDQISRFEESATCRNIGICSDSQVYKVSFDDDDSTAQDHSNSE